LNLEKFVQVHLPLLLADLATLLQMFQENIENPLPRAVGRSSDLYKISQRV
jgi:hypothetical protein